MLAVLALMAASAGMALAGFKDTTKLLGSTFSVGSADIKLLEDLSQGVVTENLADQIPAPTFGNITPNWTQDYLLKIYNNATTNVQIASNSEYTTANDPDDLRSYIFVEPFNWNDTNNNGVLDNGELGSSFGKKSIVKWKTEGFDLGTLGTGSVKGFVLRFTTDNLSDTKQGKTGVYDFIFDAISL